MKISWVDNVNDEEVLNSVHGSTTWTTVRKREYRTMVVLLLLGVAELYEREL